MAMPTGFRLALKYSDVDDAVLLGFCIFAHVVRRWLDEYLLVLNWASVMWTASVGILWIAALPLLVVGACRWLVEHSLVLNSALCGLEGQSASMFARSRHFNCSMVAACRWPDVHSLVLNSALCSLEGQSALMFAGSRCSHCLAGAGC